MGEIAQARKDLDFMPDAIKIIPSVVEEMCEDDQMEIDSKNGANGSTQDDTLAACIQCLLQCFNEAHSGKGQSNKIRGKIPKRKMEKEKIRQSDKKTKTLETPSAMPLLTLTIALGDYVEQMTGLLDQVLQHGGRQVISTGYEELRAFFTRVDQWSSDASGENQSHIMTSLSKLLTNELDGSVEAIRKGRAEAILAYLKLPAQVPDALVTSLEEWRASERSGTVQRLLDEALKLSKPRG
jgi:proteasome component ECM29